MYLFVLLEHRFDKICRLSAVENNFDVISKTRYQTVLARWSGAGMRRFKRAEAEMNAIVSLFCKHFGNDRFECHGSK